MSDERYGKPCTHCGAASKIARNSNGEFSVYAACEDGEQGEILGCSTRGYATEAEATDRWDKMWDQMPEPVR